MKQYKIISLLLISFFFISTSCSEATSSNEETTYDLEVVNEFGLALDVHIAPEETRQYQNFGSIAPGSTRIIEDLEINSSYVITATEVGGGTDNWIDQQTFSNDSTDLYTITLRPLF